MRVSEFSTGGSSVKFQNIGDKVDGTIVDEPELAPDKYSSDGTGKVLILTILEGVDGEPRKLFARKQLLTSIGNAVVEAGTDEIENGGRLSVQYVDDKPAGGFTAKVYAVKYQPPTALGRGAVLKEDDLPDW
jgi:hypothetical protein